MERNLNDAHQAYSVLEVDKYGHIIKQIDVAYGRTKGAHDTHPIQEQLLMQYSENDFTSAIDEWHGYLLPRPYETRSYEIYGFQLESNRFSLQDFVRDAPSDLPEIPYHTPANHLKQKRMTERSRTLFRSNDLKQFLPLCVIESMAFVGEIYHLSLTSDNVFQRGGESLIVDDIFSTSGGYLNLESDGNWWIPSGRSFFSISNTESELAEGRRHFFTVRRYSDPFSNVLIAGYNPFDLLLTSTTDAVGNTTESQIDYRVLQPSMVTDPNDNREQWAFDELGFVVGTAVMGKASETLGDSLEGFHAIIAENENAEYFNDPKGPIAAKLLGNASTRIIYDLTCFAKEKKPIYCLTISREMHASVELINFKTQVDFRYYDGFGRTIQQKVQTEPLSCDIPTHWTGSGWTVFNNKGNPVRKYEPFFDETHKLVFDYIVRVHSFSMTP